MKMWPLKYLTTVIWAVLFTIGDVSGAEMLVETFGVIGHKVSFGSTSLTPPISSIAWKHKISDGTIVKAIEWDHEDGVSILNQRFKDITSLNEKTGEITISKLNENHRGVYIMEINSKEQEKQFKLDFLPQVPTPKITVNPFNPEVVYLECHYNETIIWKNSAGDTLQGTKISTGESITVNKNTGNPENFYTCTLKNKASESTSDRVYERDLFSSTSALSAALITIFIILLLLVLPVFALLYKFCECFRELVYDKCKGKPQMEGILDRLYKHGDKSSEGKDGDNLSEAEEGRPLDEKKNSDNNSPDGDNSTEAEHLAEAEAEMKNSDNNSPGVVQRNAGGSCSDTVVHQKLTKDVL